MGSGGGGGGAGHSSVYVFRSLGTEAAEMEKREALPAPAWSSVWKTKPSALAAPPGFAETEDSDDYMSGLAEEIAQSMLEESEESSRFHECSAFKVPESTWGAQQAFLSTSPQSTLAGLGNWELLSPGASSNGGLSSGVSSPPTPVEASQVRKDEEGALDLLYAELLRLKMEDEIKARQQQLMQLKQQQHYQQLLWKLRQKQALPLSSEVIEAYKMAQAGSQYTNCSSTQKAFGGASLYYRSKARSDDTNQVRARKQANGAWGGHTTLHSQNNSQRGWGTVDQSNQGQSHTYGAYGLNGSQQKALHGSGMRAVFLGTPGARESGGTGVFLPRRVGSGHDSKRKPACSTVLLPSRIVQALNLNVEDTLACSSATISSAPIRRDISVSIPARVRSSAIPVEAAVDPREEWASHHYSAAACSSLQEVAPDICLPREWTY